MGTVTGDQFDASVFNEFELANIDLIVQIENEQSNDEAPLQMVVDYTGEYENADGDHMSMKQVAGRVSFEWYRNGECIMSGTDIPVNTDWSINVGGGGMWFGSDGTLEYSPGSGGTKNNRSFWKVG